MKKNTKVNLVVSEQEVVSWRESAWKEHLTLSAWIRQRCNGSKAVERTETESMQSFACELKAGLKSEGAEPKVHEVHCRPVPTLPPGVVTGSNFVPQKRCRKHRTSKPDSNCKECKALNK